MDHEVLEVRLKAEQAAFDLKSMTPLKTWVMGCGLCIEWDGLSRSDEGF